MKAGAGPGRGRGPGPGGGQVWGCERPARPEDPRPALSARTSARPVAAALHPSATQVPGGRARAPFNAQDPAEGEGRGELRGEGPAHPRPRPGPSDAPPPRVPTARPRHRRAARGATHLPRSLGSPSCPSNPDRRPAFYISRQARGSRPFPWPPTCGPREGRRDRPGGARVKLIQFARITELFPFSPSARPQRGPGPAGTAEASQQREMERRKKRSRAQGRGCGAKIRLEPGRERGQTVMEETDTGPDGAKQAAWTPDGSLGREQRGDTRRGAGEKSGVEGGVERRE